MEPMPFINKRNQPNPGSSSHQDKNFPKPCHEKPLNLDELFEFSAARQRALERNVCRRETNRPFADFFPHRVFINHIDSYHGKHLSNYIADQVMGASQMELPGEVEEGDNEITSGNEAEDEKQGKKKSKDEKHNYEIIGTLEFVHYPDYKRTEDIFDIIDQENKEELKTKILSCGFIIYDISTTLQCHPFQIEEASWILDAIIKQLEDMQKNSPKAFKKYEDCRTFILISPLTTWAKTKPIDPEDPELAFTETDYRKRKPHPNYKIHCDFEKKVIEIGRKFPKHLKTCVVGSGVTYGREEDVFHFLFKLAWQNSHLPLFLPGKNKIPIIHVDSLASVVHSIMEEFPKRNRYVAAVDESTTTLRKIVKLISKKLGNGKVIKVSKEEAYLYPDIKQRHYDMLTLNLNIIPNYIIENMDVKWSSELPIDENIDKLILEFKKARNLTPIKIFIHGPPVSGKSLLAKRLADHYKIHRLNVKGVIDSAIQSLKDRVDEIEKKEGKEEEEKEKIEIEGEELEEEPEEEEEKEKIEIEGEEEDEEDEEPKEEEEEEEKEKTEIEGEEPEEEEEKEKIEIEGEELEEEPEEEEEKEKIEIEGEELEEEPEEEEEKEKIEIEGEELEKEDEEPEEDEDVEVLKETLHEIEENMRNNDRNRLDDRYVIRFFKEKMMSNPCRNQGYVIDGYPKTLELTKILYEPQEDTEEVALEEEEEEKGADEGVEKLCNRKLLPDYVESLDASDEFLIRRVIAMPEIQVQNTHYAEEDMCRRLTEFRTLNTEENTPLIFYDEMDVHPMIYNVECDTNPDMEHTFRAIIKHVGSPRNYGLEGAELEERLKLEDKIKKQQKYEEIRRKEEEARLGAQRRRDNMERWMFLKDQEKEMEEKALAVLAMPLRHYLMKYIFPTLTRGLVEVARIRPDDPVDYLAEFLFRENPEGKMFQPDYLERSDDLSRTLDELESWKEDDKASETFTTDRSPLSGEVSRASEIHAKFSRGRVLSENSTKSVEKAEDKPQAEEIESWGNCTCSHSTSSGTSSSSSGITSPPGSVCTCGPYPEPDDSCESIDEPVRKCRCK